jgi:hypothetical protein
VVLAAAHDRHRALTELRRVQTLLAYYLAASRAYLLYSIGNDPPECQAPSPSEFFRPAIGATTVWSPDGGDHADPNTGFGSDAGTTLRWVIRSLLRLRALQTGLPICVLLFMIPLPPIALTAIIAFLQKTSADAPHYCSR